MKRLLILSLGAVLAVGLIVQTAGASSSRQKVLEFDTMVRHGLPIVEDACEALGAVRVDEPLG